MRRFLKKLLLIFVILNIIPYILVVVYAFVPPLSFPIVAETVKFNEVSWRWRSIDRISHHLPRAIIAAEDNKFCQHNGVDWKALKQVVDRAQDGDLSGGGASTINMQITKNLFLWPLPKVIRKPLEIPLALWTDVVWSKKRTMEIYMNVAQFGDGVYGAEAGALKSYHKSAYSLDKNQSSLMAAILPNPEGRSAAEPRGYVTSYANIIRQRAGRVNAGCLN